MAAVAASVSVTSVSAPVRRAGHVDRSLNESSTDKIRKFRATYNNNDPTAISFIPPIPSTSGMIHSEFVILLFYKLIGKLTVFFAASGV